MKPILKVDDLCVEFGTGANAVRVLDHVSFDLQPGEVLGIVGESGCGKSMTSLATMRLIPNPPGRITKGSVVLDGEDLLQVNEARMQDVRGNDIAMIFQEPMTALNPVFTIGTQIMETLRRHQSLSAAQAREQAIELLGAVHIPEPARRIKQYPHELSGGMRQRAMIAMALACRPKVLIADEPTTALDVTVQAQIFDLLRDLRDRFGTSIIMITHNMGAVAELADRVMVMYAGRKIEEGPVARVLEAPQHPYTKGLLECVLHVERGEQPEEPQRLPEIPGVVPPLNKLGPGCPFAPRCPYAFDKCQSQRPPLFDAGTSKAACWLVEPDAAAARNREPEGIA